MATKKPQRVLFPDLVDKPVAVDFTVPSQSCDGGFAETQLLDWLEDARLAYTVNMPKNSVLQGLAAPWMPALREQARAEGKTATAFADGCYRAGTWTRERRIIIKAEVVCLRGREPRDNERFLITNLPWTPRRVYRFCAARGDAENRIKELKDGLRFDLTSCTDFLANQFRVLLSVAAYALCQQLRHAARGAACERAQVGACRAGP